MTGVLKATGGVLRKSWSNSDTCGSEPGQVREVFWMILRSASISRDVGQGFLPPLNPAVENMTFTLRTDIDKTES